MECILKLYVLDKKPKKTWYKQLLYHFTRPLAKLIYSFDTERQKEVKFKRDFIASLNKRDFINEVAKILFDEVKTRGIQEIDEPFCKMLCRDEAKDIFYEKKSNGGFDELNIMQ